jgi:hypothetical protein
LLAAEAAAIAAVAAAAFADEAASLALEAALIAAEADVSAAEAAMAEAPAEADAASAVGAVVVSAGLLQAARATAATTEANRSDLFMNFLEENLVRTITGNFGYLPSQQVLLTKDSRPSSSISCA